MLGFWSRESKDRDNAGDRRREGYRLRRAHIPRLEGLEVRMTPATATWAGAGTDNNWTTPANWSGDKIPAAGDDLDFPAGATTLTATNNFPAGTSFGSITIEASGYTLAGNSMNLTGVITTTYSSGTSINAIDTNLGGASVVVGAGGRLNLFGILSGSAGMTISGGGQLDLEAANTYPGTTTLTGTGTKLLVNGSVGAVQVNSGTVLGGVGTVGAVTSSGGTLSPGDSPGVLHTGSLTLNSSSTFLAELDGTTPGNGTTGYDQVVAGGPVNLGGAALSAAIGGGYAPHVGDRLTIIQNNSGSAITGTFVGLPEGSDFNISGSVFQITYAGGPAGDNVVLTTISTATTTTLTSSPNPAVVGQPVTFTAQVSTPVGTPTGTVTFLANGTPIGMVLLLSLNSTTGQATLTIPALGVGASTITAAYTSNNPALESSQSSALTQFVTIAGTQPIVTALAVRNRRGQLIAVDLVTQVPVTAPGTGVATGTVTYFFNPRTFQTIPLRNGTAVLRLIPRRILGHFLFVQYNGDANFEPSVSTSQVVRPRILKTAAPPLTVRRTAASMVPSAASVSSPYKARAARKSFRASTE